MSPSKGPAYINRGTADYGDWTQVVRELSEGDYERAERIKRWPVREALVALVARLKRQALEGYRFELLLWAATAPHSKKPQDPPKLPDILKA